MFHEKFKNIAAGIQSIFLAVAVMVGGWWTLHTFDPFQLREQRSVNVNIKSSQVKIPGELGSYICALVEFTNAGKHPEVFRWPPPDDPLFIATRISLAENGTLVTRTSPGVKMGDDLGVRLLPGQVQRRVFLVRVDGPGLYHLNFKVPASSEEQDTASERDRIKKGIERMIWMDAGYMTVE